MKLYLVITVLMLSLFESAYAEKKHKFPTTFLNGLTSANATTSSFAVINNELAVLYTNNNKLRLKLKNGKILLDEGATYSPRNTWLIAKENYVYVFWWVKFVYKAKNGKKQIIKGKSLYVRASNDYGKTFFPKVRVNTDHGVLPDINIVADNQGHVSIIYNDERAPKYQVYINSSLDGGKTWPDKDTRLDKVAGQEVKKIASHAGTPHLVNIDNKLIAIWQQYDQNNGKPITRIIARQSEDFGITWGIEETIFQSKGDVASTLDVLATDDEVYVFWLDIRKKGLALFSRKADAKKWFASDKIAPGTSTDFAISWLEGVADENYLYLAFTYEKTLAKDYVKSIKYNRKKKRWSPGVHRLDKHPSSLKYVAKSMNSDIVMLPNKTILIAWEDYDKILPNINLDVLSTQNQKWLPNKIRVTDPSLDARAPKIYLGLDKLWIVFYLNRLVEGRPPYTELAVLNYELKENIDIDITSIVGVGGRPNGETSKKLLRSRANSIWTARMEKNKENEWPYYDPVYRSKFNKSKWLEAKGGLTFEKFNITKIDIKGEFARVKGFTTYLLPKEKMVNSILDPEDLTHVYTKPEDPIKTGFDMKFGWFGDNWYFIPEVIFMNHLDD